MLNQLHFHIDDEALKRRAFEAIVAETETIGYYALPQQSTQHIAEYAASIDSSVDTIIVIGIGGSSLGAKAVYEFLAPKESPKRRLVFLESTDPVALHKTLETIDFASSHIFVISKSGTTVETFAIYKYIFHRNPHPQRYTFITDPGSRLEAYARKIGAACFNLPANVGGRFSVLSAVGLLPLAACGIDIDALLAGANHIKKSFFGNGYMKDVLLTKAVYYAKYHARYHINCLFAYSESLKYFCEWYVQLWGESLGKRQRHSAFHVGLTPIGLIGPKDQHSFLQLIMEGTRDKTVTFIKIDDFDETVNVPELSLPHLESLDMLNGISFEQLINMQCDAITESLLAQGDIPVDMLVIPRTDAFHMGALIFYYELLTSLVGELIDVNTYDQPGVEAGKIILKQKLADRLTLN